ncbi:MAG: hypothetical protein NVSMB56_01920 [Pyrinomonadaceae bacterium]
MSDAPSKLVHDEVVETALLDADLFLKYQSPERAIERLRVGIEAKPRAIALRERLRELCVAHKLLHEAARQCLALAGLYLQRDEFDIAHDRLLDARQLDPRISITPGLEAVRRAKRGVTGQLVAPTSIQNPDLRAPTLAGDLSVVSIFDAVQTIENARLTGTLKLWGGEREGSIFFNEGRIIDAQTKERDAINAFQSLIGSTGGYFDFTFAEKEFPVTISAASNTNLMLEVLRQLDEEKG